MTDFAPDYDPSRRSFWQLFRLSPEPRARRREANLFGKRTFGAGGVDVHALKRKAPWGEIEVFSYRWTFGTITNSCVAVNVSGSTITQLCQNIVNAGVGGGDSGSPVFNWSGTGSNVTLAGILWGGSSDGTTFVFSPMSGIERELGALTTF